MTIYLNKLKKKLLYYMIFQKSKWVLFEKLDIQLIKTTFILDTETKLKKVIKEVMINITCKFHITKC